MVVSLILWFLGLNVHGTPLSTGPAVHSERISETARRGRVERCIPVRGRKRRRGRVRCTRSRRWDIRITEIHAHDDGSMAEGSGSGPGIDVVQDVCDEEQDVLEQFFDTVLSLKVVNTSVTTVRFSKFSYSLRRADALGKPFNSRSLSLIPGGEVPADGERTMFGILTDVQDDRKAFIDSATTIPEELGVRNVTVRLTGRDGLGKTVRITGRIALSFDNFNRCS